MHVDHQGFPGEFLGGDAGVVAEPVVGVDYVKFVLALHGDGSTNHGVAGHLFHEVGAVLAGEFVFLAIAYGEVLHLALFLFLDEFGELLGVCVRYHVGADVNELHFVKIFLHGF